MKTYQLVVELLLLGLLASTSLADDSLNPSQLATMDIEQLMNVDITSVSKKDEKLMNAAAAVYVLSNDEIRRSGATSVPEALRMVPGLSVARISGNLWAITSRGFNGQFANKLLVLRDGRSVYTPLFSGVYWDVQDLPMDNIERIEVIRGPGAALWGANAVNGVINIITKSSSQTKGWLVTGGAGNKDRDFGTLQYGGDLPIDGTYRAYLKYSKSNHYNTKDGQDGEDGAYLGKFGFRTDWKSTPDDTFSMQGSVHNGSDETQNNLLTSYSPPVFTSINKDTKLSGGNVVGRWDHKVSDDSDMKLQTFFDRTNREGLVVNENRNTFDVDFQHRIRLNDTHDFLYGLGFRNTSDDLQNKSLSVLFTDNSRSDNLFSSFLQDDITLIPSRLHLIAGSKFEHNDYTGNEFQPSLRSYLTLNEHNTLWASVARAVRTPSRADDNVQFLVGSSNAAAPLPGFIYANGNPGFDSEELFAYEVGYRGELSSQASVDLSAFYNRYQGLRGIEPKTDPFVDGPPPHLIVPLMFSNSVDSSTYGFEATTTIKPLDFLKWKTNFSFLQVKINPDTGSVDTSEIDHVATSPQNQLMTWLAIDPMKDVETDFIMYYVDSLRTGNVPSYIRFDARAGYQITSSLNLSAVVQNVFDNKHLEFVDTVGFTPSTEMRRAYYAKLTWRF